MKRLLLSTVAACVVAGSLSGDAITLYQDPNSGAVYTKDAPGRIKLGDFISVKDIKEAKSKTAKALKVTQVNAKVPVLKFSGTHYLGYTYTDYEDDSKESSSKFETRRNYLQIKAYWNKKDYMRVTLDTYQDKTDDWKVRLKYAYVYFSDVLPNTGMEFGQAHRPWIDYEEHNGWLYRSIAKVFVEEHNGAHLTNSADLGVDFKTKTPYFSSEIGLFNGEGYHGRQSGNSLSFEWRLTANLLGTGKKHVHLDDEYAKVSFLGQQNSKYKGADDLNWWGIHAVYNQPLFLLAAMYVDSDNEGGSHEGKGYSVNAEVRPIEKWSFIGRYDDWTDKSKSDEPHKKEYIVGVAYKYNKNVKMLANIFSIDPNDNVDDDKKTKYMLTTEVKW